MSNPNKKSGISSTIIWIAFMSGTIAPIIINFISGKGQHILHRKVDQEYMQALAVIVAAFKSDNIYANKTQLSQIHVAEYEKAQHIVKVNDNQVHEFITSQSAFKENGTFSLKIYTGFLVKSEITEVMFNKIMAEILCVKIYQDILKPQIQHLGVMYGQLVQDVIKKKQISYDYYKLDISRIPSETADEKQLRNIYDQRKKANDIRLFQPSLTIGYLIKSNVSWDKSKKIKITKQQIQQEFKENIDKYQYKQITIHMVVLEQDLIKSILRSQEQGVINIEDVKKKYNFQSTTYNSINHKNILENVVPVYQQVGLNKLVMAPLDDEKSILIYISDYQIIDPKIDQVQGLIKDNLQRKNYMEKKIKKMHTLRDQIKSNQKLGEDPEFIKKNKIICKKVELKEGDSILTSTNNSQNAYIKDNETIVFLPIKKISKHLMSWETIDKNTLQNIYIQERKASKIREEMKKMTMYLNEGSNYNHSQWTHTRGLVNILNYNKNDIQLENVMKFSNRDVTTTLVKENSILKSRVSCVPMEINGKSIQNIHNIIEELIHFANQEDKIAMVRKVHYYEYLKKYV